MDIPKLIEELKQAEELIDVMPNRYYRDLYKRATDALESLQAEMIFTREFIHNQGLEFTLLSEYAKHNPDSF